MDKILTMVVPSYNVEETLRQTVESMLVPDLELRSLLDILIVNDGSKDHTQQLAQQLAEENPGVVRVWDKENGGHGSTINVGIERADGKYLKVVDGDDWLDTQELMQYIMILKETDADVVATDYYRYFMNSGKREVVKISELPYNQLMYFQDVWEKYTFCMHSVGVKTAILREQAERIDEHCFYVDTEYDTLIALNAKTLLYIDIKLYVYRLQREGQSVSLQGLMKHYTEHGRIVLTHIQWFRQPNLCRSVERSNFLKQSILKYGKQHYYIGLRFPQNERKEFLAHLRAWDAEIAQTSQEIYQSLHRYWLVKCLRISRFSDFLYTFLHGVKRMKHRLVKRTD